MTIGKGWCIVLAVRLAIGFFLHYGYIHPDEYFQSTEIAAGDILDLKVYRPWEFNGIQHIRSIIPVYLMSGFPLIILKLLAHIMQIPINGAMILRTVRLWMMLLTFTIDWNLYKTMKSILKENKETSPFLFLKVLTSSFIMLTFGVKTFSNTLEMILFAWLLRLTLTQEFRQNIPSLASILVIGIFTRPTFVIFTFLPLCFSLFKSSNFRIKFILRDIIECVFYGSGFLLMFVFIDSVYFKTLNLHNLTDNIGDLNSQDLVGLLKNNLTVTPLNFILYNIKNENLAQHGIHNRITHSVVNAPTLFYGLIVLAYFDALSRCFGSKINLTKHLSGANSLVLLSTCLFSLFMLSLFPHQEPRFLVPLLIPLVILYAPRITKYKTLFIIFWIVPNLVMTYFWGSIHQAGVVPAILSARNKLIASHLENGDHVTAIFWKSYMPPQSLFAIPLNASFVDKSQNIKAMESNLLNVIDLAGASEKELFSNLGDIFGSKNSGQCSKQKIGSDKNFVYLFVPGSVVRGSECLIKGFNFRLVIALWPHFSGEHPPIFNQYSLKSLKKRGGVKKCLLPYDWLCKNMPESTHSFIDSMSYKIFSVVQDCS